MCDGAGKALTLRGLSGEFGNSENALAWAKLKARLKLLQDLFYVRYI